MRDEGISAVIVTMPGATTMRHSAGRPAGPYSDQTFRAFRGLVWAQVHGAKLVTKDEKERFGEWYVCNAPISLDLDCMDDAQTH